MPFYKNVCSLLASINSGIVHQRPSVKLPLTKVGLELSQVLTNLGILSGFSVGQRLSRLPGHSRVWDPAAAAAAAAGPGPAPSSAYAGFPGLYLHLQLNWAKHQPLSAGALAAAGARPGGAAASFSPPAPLHSPTPEAVKIISKPSHQRWVSLAQLLAARAAAPPGVFLLSTHQGLLTDIDAELRGLGGILLGRLTLPLGHVLQLRGLLRAKHQQELAAAAAAAAAAAPGAPAGQQAAPVHAPLREWDARAAAGQAVSRRLERLSRLAAAEGEAYMRGAVLGPADEARQQRSAAADDKATLLRLQELVWRRRQQGGEQPKQQQQHQQSAGAARSRVRRSNSRSS